MAWHLDDDDEDDEEDDDDDDDPGRNLTVITWELWPP